MIIKNISNANIVIEGKVLVPNEILEVDKIDMKKYKKFFESNILKQEIENVVVDNKEFNFNDLKNEIISSLFKLYLNENLDSSNLELLKWFYKNVSITSNIDSKILNLIDDIESSEELIEVLLNHIYPSLLENHFKIK
jgi:hypothetical protein